MGLFLMEMKLTEERIPMKAHDYRTQANQPSTPASRLHVPLPSSSNGAGPSTSNCQKRVERADEAEGAELLFPAITTTLRSKIDKACWEGVGVVSPTCGRVRLQKVVKGIIKRRTIHVLYDSGSDNSWCDASLSDYACMRQAVKYKVDTMLGSSENQDGETWHMAFELPDGTTRKAALLKANNYKSSPTAKVQQQLISCPQEFAKNTIWKKTLTK